MLQAMEPFLAARDINETASFWRDELGFAVTGQSETWLRVARDDVAFMFSAGEPASNFDGVFVVRATDVDAIARSVASDPEWGPRDTVDHRHEVAYRDPNGYIVNFTQNTDEAGGTC